MADLSQRYLEAWKQSWSSRGDATPPQRLAHELEFLPANLELVDSPPHPIPLWTTRIIAGLILLFAIIAAFGELDIIAVAPGKLVPGNNVKLIQPAMTAVVRKILVKNGDRVSAGQLLVDLDPTQAAADLDRIAVMTTDDELAIALSQALLTAQLKNITPAVAAVPGAPDTRQLDTQSLAMGMFTEYQQRLGSMKSELNRREAELATTEVEVEKLRRTAPLSEREASEFEKLAQENYVSNHDYIEKEKIAIDQSHELAAQQSRSRELAAAIDSQRRDIEGAIATFRKEQLERLSKANQEINQYHLDETKAHARLQLTRLTSPVNGIVQQLNIHTVGGVVTGAQKIMEIVPDDDLEVDAAISNKDIGFVEAGQSATIKIATFPYARFGYLTGKVSRIANDATSDGKPELVFMARLRISDNRFKVGNRYINLSPGMEVSAEIKTGRQSVWRYFLSPLIETGRDSLKER